MIQLVQLSRSQRKLKKALAENDTAKIQASLNKAIAVCESGEYTVLTAESEE